MMPKYVTVFVIMLCMHPIYAQQLIQLGNGMTLMPLSQIGALDVDKLECSPQLADMSHSVQAWQEILEKQDQMDSDLDALKKVHQSIQDFKSHEFHPQVLLQVRHIHKQIFMELKDSQFSELSPYQTWRNEEINGLQGQLNFLDTTKNIEQSEECCNKVEQMIDQFMKQLEQLKQECSKPNVNINSVNKLATKVEQTEEACKPTGEANEELESEPSEPSSEGGESTEDEEDKDVNLDTKEHSADSTRSEPIAEQEEQGVQNFKEYGYGYWARFMLNYPKKLPNGKDAPWYFISRLTSNKKYDNVGMGDRILAVWLGKGFYTFTTCDVSNPNVHSNVNYPDDIDGLWTYVYYSYSVEKKKAVAFIKYGDDDEAFKTVAYDVTHPETKYLKFIIGGKDADRYPAFNGVITSVYYNNKEGAFKDSDEEVLGFLQAQKKQPQSVIPSLMSYKLLAQPVTRTPETNEIHQIIGGAKTRFPLEYAFSGWFKWTPLEQQEEWHVAFRVQINTPSTDKFLGDRTLSMLVGKTGGILHLPTYTYTTMEGEGNNNLAQNIAHKDRITKWFFVYFGYSKNEQNAYAFVKFTKEEESLDYEKVNHFTVPKFYVFIGKDKHFQGFSGQIAHAAFVMGEGSFKKGSDFKEKNDPFRFVIGAKQLTGTKPAVKEEDSADIDDGVVYNSSTDENKPKVDESVEADEHLTEYGYGFWARYLTMYPTRMQQGLIAPWYFVSRLTINKNYGNIEMGDRTLAIWQGQGRYVYCTNDAPTSNPNVVGNMVYPEDIEGVWTYFYYSYSVQAKKAVGFAKFNTDEPKQLVQDVTHPTTKFFRFIVGGKDANRYPGFNGLFSQVYFNHKDGVFIDSIEKMNALIKRSVLPAIDLKNIYKHQLVEDQIKRKPNTAADYDEVGGGQQKFPHEYAISGWFKWDPVEQKQWHSVFRVQIKKPLTDKFLGDRTLSCWINKSQKMLHFPTYTYTGMKAEGNPNLVRNIPHKNRHLEWFFIYFGYSKNQRKAFVGVRFSNSIETIQYTDVNHYYTPKFYSYVGKDPHFSGFSGKIAYVNFALGEGAFRGTPNFKHPEDIFGLAQGETALLKQSVIKPQPTIDQETGVKTVPNAVNDNKPKVNKEFNSEEPLQEYGYGYWARFLTNYPVRLYKGKKAAWYFMSRMSTNAMYGNVGMGDRALAIWQGQGFYLFTTCSTSPANPNMYQKINSPADIEGLWTYVYYSHSVAQKKTVGFIKFGDQEVQSVDFEVTHPTTKYVRYTLGGKDSNTYPGFNGQFTQLVFSATPGAFIDSAPKFNEFLSKKPSPVAAKHPLSTTKLVEAQVSRTTNVAPTKESVQVQFPKEYAISGWFKWEPTKQEVWHNAFRVQIQTPSTDRNLGDRTLSMWLGTGAGGILHISTYTYTNMNADGNPNMPQNIPHENRHLNWFYVYFGYSKDEKHGNAYVKWTKGDNSLDFNDVNHYFTSTFYVFAGKDNQFPGFNGQVAYISFNAGEGAYKKGTDFTHPTDIFSVQKGQQNLFPKVDPQKPVVQEKKGELINAFNNNAPRLDKEVNSLDNLAEYGYGFWARYLTTYPTRMMTGKNQPWYFVSRLTANKEYENIRMSDRTLAIWQGQGYYTFTTCNVVTNNVNQLVNINYPLDIEGLWTFIYYSYSVDAKKAVAFIKYGDGDIQTSVLETTHPATKFVRFILGGTDAKRSPGFNGLFTSVTFSAMKGAYVESAKDVAAYLEKNPSPSSILSELVTSKLIETPISRVVEDEPFFKSVGKENKFPHEYALSGWFKWTPVTQLPWHNIFRVAIRNPSADGGLGDRTFSCWLHAGILHFPTYTYSNMNGEGNSHVQNVDHKDRHLKWFFIYYGYQKKTATAFIYIKWNDSEDSVTYEKINHYFAAEYFIFVGRDKFFPGFNGRIGYANFNAGEGAFRKMASFEQSADALGFKSGMEVLILKKFSPIEAEKGVLENAHDVEKPVLDKEANSETKLEEYGYGFWARYLTTYPTRMMTGKKEPWYFVSRLTANKEYDNIRMSDRTLAIWQGQGYYTFITCNVVTDNVNQLVNINYPLDIEGLWTFIYYSYSVDAKKAVAFIKYGDGDIQTSVLETTHPATNFVRFILGGTDAKRYPGFNGLFTSVTFSAMEGAYVESAKDVAAYLEKNPNPSSILSELVTSKLIETPISRVVEDEPLFKSVGKENKFPHEYALSGWFKWTPKTQLPWHNIFRVAIRNPSADGGLGDRTFSCWLHAGLLHFPTYTYSNMNGEGNSHVQNVNHKDRHLKWFFIYYGYQKKTATAFIYIKWNDSEDSVTYEKINHYFAAEYFIFVGRDKFFPGFNGRIGYANFNAGEGAFRKTANFEQSADAFGFKSGIEVLIKKKFSPIEAEKGVLENATDVEKPVLDKEANSETKLEEYGYGFWARYLTTYPTRMMTGKKEPWYFVSRLTANKEYDNIRMSDRTLAIWQGQGYYTFITCNVVTDNVNQLVNINYPLDIEGLWTFIYYSYSVDAKKAVAFIKYGDGDIQTSVLETTHPATNFVRFILGGTDAKRYPGFNGLFTSVTFSAMEGAYVESAKDVAAYLEKNPNPSSILSELVTSKLIETPISRVVEDEPLFKSVGKENKFPHEYALSGWFKWTPVTQLPWHNIFRVAIRNPSADGGLGDRTFSCWLHAGLLHFPTYTYSNMNGEGNSHVQNVNHKDRHLKWFFIYYGYQKKTATAFIYIKWNDSEDSVTYEKINHYFAAEYFIFVGRDKFFPGFNGRIGYANFNAGEGAFRKIANFEQSADAFGFKSGIEVLIKKKFSPIEAEKGVLENATDVEKPVLDKEANSETKLEEYGYGFWARYLTAYPTRMMTGKKEPWYFVSRLTANKEYDNIRMSDRTLAIWQGQGYYTFITCNVVTDNVNQLVNINYPQDIEGLWTFIYYSYSVDAKKAVAFIKYGDGDIQTSVLETTHPATNFVRFILGGTDAKRYPGFNGLFTSVTFSAMEGAYVESAKDVAAYLQKNPSPSSILSELVTSKLIETPISRVVEDEPLFKSVGKENKFPHEYALSGWFKWTPVTQLPWHNIFRVAIRNPSADGGLGDRTFSCWLHAGLLHFPTYTYSNMNGEGNSHVQNVNHKDRHLKWFFIYYGYQKKTATAFIYIKWNDSEDSVTYEKINHYFAAEYFIFVGRDKFFPGFNGRIGYANFNAGEGAFRKTANFEQSADAFGFKSGIEVLIKKKFSPIEAEKGVLENATDVEKPVLDKEANSETKLEEYGYGFWARYLTAYPTRMMTGKKEPWYFVSRLTANKEYDNIRMSDRTLAIWQGQGYYTFITCNVVTDNVNQLVNINYPLDIEGLWTFIYYSYSVDTKKAVAFIKYGDGDIQTSVLETTHPATNFVRFILGGTDAKRYPGFNGLFTSVTFSAMEGAYVESAKDVAAYLEKNPSPSSILSELVTSKLIETPISRVVEDEPLFKSVGKENKFPHEYALSGWFKWTPVTQLPWHNIFRVAIRNPSADGGLGDRTFSCWLHAGLLHFPTYTYSNMNGEGNSHVQNVNHKDRHLKWFFIYYGYQKKTATAFIYIKWNDSEDSVTYEKINHYFAAEYFIFVGRDKFFPGFNGRIGYANFNAGEGAFRKTANFEQSADAFGFKSGIEVLIKKKFSPIEAEKGVLENATDVEKPVLDKEANSETKLEEYGYGFWARYLTTYPTRMMTGKKEPWYFVSRLTANKEYDNIRMSDRTLAIWQGQGYYTFITCNVVTDNVNQLVNINYPLDIEGLWTFIYYSYSVDAKKAVAFIKYGDGDIQTSVLETTHPATNFVRFILGGTDAKRYPGFNGLFTSVTFSATEGAYVESAKDVAAYLEKNPSPSSILSELVTSKLIETPISRVVEDEPLFKSVGKENKFPHEYALSGWFKWTPVTQLPWHNIFRVAIRNPSADGGLGDRTFSCWLHAGLLHFPTYTYSNMNGEGNSHVQNVNHKDRHLKWFFIYYGYQKKTATAFIYIKWNDSEDSVTYEKINHYFAAEYFIFVGRDKFFPGFNGRIGYANFNAGEGAFRKIANFEQSADAFGFKSGIEVLIKKKFSPIEAEKGVLENATDVEKPVLDKEANSETKLEEYGYGFWARYLTAYPTRMMTGKKEPWYFVSRLTANKEYDNIRMSDRTLAIWQGQGYYTFITCNVVTDNVNQLVNINYPQDIEGLWTFIYYSYSVDTKKAVAFIKYGDGDIQTSVLETTHPATNFVRFILGGTDAKRYPGFNGLFTSVTFSAMEGAYVESAKDVAAYLEKNPSPSSILSELVTSKLIETPISRVVEDEPLFKSVGKENKFPHEYALSGWFKWTPVTQLPWHNIFRVAIRNPSADGGLGDRTFSCWLHAGLLHFPTYTYSNMNGEGNSHVQNVNHKDRHLKWFFIYYGYQKKTATAFIYIKWNDSEDSVTYEKINHYFAAEYFVFVGRDKFFPGFNGRIGYANFNAGEGAFRKTANFEQSADAFGFKSGIEVLIKKKFSPIEAEKGVLENATDVEKPVLDKEANSETKLEEYGYGFWARYLTAYPTRMMTGKKEPWYFVSRLTANKEYDNIRMSDRTLAIWQGQGYYTFITCNVVTDNVNQLVNINYPLDIEGLWTFIYYSYSVDTKKAVAFIKYGDGDIQTSVLETTHPATNFVRFILGGTDAKRYPGFNGLFTSVTFSAMEGAYVESAKDVAAYLEKNPSPSSILSELVTSKLIETPISRVVEDEPLFKSVGKENKFPHEYALSGWFKWTPVTQLPLHNIFRVAIRNPSADGGLGDRTFSCWLHAGLLHFPTYTYSNMNGEGNSHVQNVDHKDRHLKWFFIYYGYQKKTATAFIYIKWNDSEDSVTYEKINHYFAAEYFIFVGRDKFFPGFNGRIGYANFNAGEGAFRKIANFEQSADAFGFKSGIEVLIKKKFSPIEAEKGVLENATDVEKPVLDKEANSETKLEEYGYGFWARYLTAYPTRMMTGKKEPWYFVSRLTANKEYDNIRMSDRTLAIWQGQGYYTFITCNVVTDNVNQLVNINYPLDIEGLWTFIYYSYSVDAKKAVAFIKYGDGDIQTSVLETTHPATNFVRFILGGTDAKRYPGFNGLFTSVTFSAMEGAYVESAKDVAAYLEKNPSPSSILSELVTSKLIETPISRVVEDEPLFKSVGKENKFPHEYALSGWFKWTPVTQLPWHNIFRVAIRNPSADGGLGDRTFSCWLHAGLLHFPTYTYSNMNGEGNSHVQNVDHKDRHLKWFFIYYGYQKKTATAFIYIKWNDSEDSVTYEKINHYFAAEYFIFVGRDKFFPGFNGRIGYANFNAGEGAFRKIANFEQSADAFGFKSGIEVLIKKKFSPIEAEKGVLENATDVEKPVLDKEANSETKLEEYGYGFWARYLTAYPTRMMTGKKEPWYFVSRLTANKEYDNIRMSDRTLAIWQGQGYYTFITCNVVTDNVNQLVNINYPLDIEGLWTFIYYSYSVDAKKAVAFIKYGDGDIQTSVLETTHPATKFVRFILGGTDAKRYPGFNGLFTSVTFSATEGAYVESAKDVAAYLEKNPSPSSILSELVTSKLIETPISRVVEDEPLFKSVGKENKFPHEYALSGWFKWTPVTQLPWHNIFRVAIRNPSADGGLGDRTFSCWLHAGLLHFPTYTYSNMNGEGNSHVQNVDHKDRHLKWFFIYYGYQKKTATAFIYIKWSDSEDSVTYEKINHYFAAEYFIFVGRDKFFPGFNGRIGYANFNAGEGAFRKGNNFNTEQGKPNAFQFEQSSELNKPTPINPITSDKEKLLSSSFEQAEPVFETTIQDSENTPIRGINEYGWALWCRWSRTGPKNLLWKQDYHSLARLTINKNHGDAVAQGDRTLAIWVGRGYYHFTTYTEGNNNVISNTPYKTLDGEWNFITFTYKQGLAKSIVWLSEKHIVANEMKVTHLAVTDYIHFQIKKEFNYQLFNGHFTNVQVRLGPGAFVDEKDFKILATGELRLLDSAKYNQGRKTVVLQKEKKTYAITDKVDDIIIKPEDVEGKNEYSISGWAKWTDSPQMTAWHLLFRATTNNAAQMNNANSPGDRTLAVWKGAGYYHFCTYNVDQENIGSWGVAQNSDFQGSLHKTWSFFYFGYSKTLHKVHGYVKYPSKEDHLNFENINHLVPTQFIVQMHLDKWFPGFNGAYEAWYFNAGEGAYKESGYGNDENEVTTFGFGGLTQLVPKAFTVDEPFTSFWGPDQVVGKEVTYADESVNGLTEYGYGMWTRFAWNGPKKLVSKPAWLALSRLTLNENYQGDAAQIGDRCLAIWVGTGYFQFTTSTPGNNNAWTNVNYNQMLDGQWNYIYFGYKKTPEGGKVAGHILFNGLLARSTNYGNIVHPVVADFLYFAVGSSGAKLVKNYHSFNGIISKVTLVLGDGGYQESADVLRKALPAKPTIPEVKDIKKIIVKEQIVLERADDKVAPKEFADEFEGATDYSVSLWYKWSPIARVAWENIYSLTQNEPGIRANNAKQGDRVLSLFQYTDSRQLFSTYTTPDVHDALALVHDFCGVPAADQTQWLYAYMGYSREAGSVQWYLKTKSSECEKKSPAMHITPKYFALYVGKDGMHTPFNGRISEMYLYAGREAFRDRDYKDFFEPYLQGVLSLSIKPFRWTEKKALFEQPFDLDTNSIEFKPEEVDGQTSYGYGFWMRYLTAIPKRVLAKPAWMQISRLTVNKDGKDMTSTGDRTLAVWVGQGYYHFTTYNQNGNAINLTQNIDYGSNLEGVWTFLYFSYSSVKQSVVGFIKFGNNNEVKRIAWPNIVHRSIENYAKFTIGKQFTYEGFNGQIAQLQVIFGNTGYIHDVDTLEEALKSQFTKPEIKEPGAVIFKAQEEQKEKKFDDKPQMTEWPTEFKESLEYSIFGWFRYTPAKLASANNVFIRLTANEPAYRKEYEVLGDRTLLILYQLNEVVFATYSLGKVDSGFVNNIRKPTPLGNNYGVWTYVWFGYSWNKQEGCGVAKFPTSVAKIPYENIQHMVPRYFALFAGSDGYLGGWVGPMAKVGALFGKGAYVDTSKGNYENLMPEFKGFDSNPTAEWKPENDDIEIVPKGDKPGYDLTFKEQAGGVNTYGYGMWTRWLMTTPDRVVEKQPWHQMIRLTSTEKYDDMSEFGNRVLAIWTGKGYYHFTTYDKATNKVTTNQNVNYDDYLEGHWNYIYFSYTAKDKPRAVGFVVFGDLEGQVSRVEFPGVTHNPLNGFARVTVASKEFSYPAFNGMVSKLRVYFGKGFIDNKEDLLKNVISANPKPVLNLLLKTNMQVLKDQTGYEKGKDGLMTQTDKFAGVLEYAVSGWVRTKGNREQTSTVFRLTINAPTLLKDNANAGDRALAGFVNKDSYIYSTYDYGNLDTNDDDKNDINNNQAIGKNQNEWTFMYFGYNTKIRKAFAYTLFTNREDSYQYKDLKHFVPNNFWIYLGSDKFYPTLDGTLFNWNLHFGEGSYTTKPKETIEIWPYEPKTSTDSVLSALLSNQGLNSVKLIKEKPMSELIAITDKIEKQAEADPLVGQMKKNSVSN